MVKYITAVTFGLIGGCGTLLIMWTEGYHHRWRETIWRTLICFALGGLIGTYVEQRKKKP